MRLEDIIEHLPRGQLTHYLSSLNRPARAELLMYGLAGALVGAGIALLFAPTRGSELRSKIGERIDEYMNLASEPSANGHDRTESA
jgi:hypothetical protein